MHLTLRTPTSVLYDGDASVVRLKTDLGRMEILPGHATLVGTILYSKVYVRHEQTEEKFIIRQATVVVNENGDVTVLATEGHKEEELTIETMQQYLELLAEQLRSETLNEYQQQFLEESRAALQEGLAEKSQS